MDDIIKTLHKKVVELLERSQKLDDALNSQAQGAPPDQATVNRISNLLKDICDALTHCVAVLSNPGSPLDALIDGVTATVSTSKTQLERFLNEHRQILARLTVSHEVVDKVIEYLETEVKEEHMEDSDELKSKTVKDSLESLRKIVCELSGAAHDLQIAWDADLLRPVAKGVVGACIVVVDITAAASAPQFTFFVLVTVVKSTHSGVKMINNAVGQLRDRLAGWKASVSRTRMNRDAPPPGRRI